jgi:quinol monooxygenase YgiN
MVVASLQFRVKHEKRGEFVRAAETFVATLRQVSGCLDCRLLSDCEARDVFTVKTEWEAAPPLRLFLDSNEFRAMLGTRILLHHPPGLCIDEVLRRTTLTGRGRAKLGW